MKQTIVFFGSGDYTIPVVEKLNLHNLKLVVTAEKESKLVEFCIQNNIDYVVSHLKENEIIEKIKNLKPSVAVLASYGAFVPDNVITAFPNGIINIHPSLLPKHKGPSPIQYALLNGESVTGVTLIKLDNEIDHGPVLSQKPYKLSGNETAQDLLSILFEMGGEMVEELVVKLETGENLTETPQDVSKESWSYKIEKKDGMIDTSSPEFKISNLKFQINNMIRAFYPWPGVWFHYSSPVIASEARQSKLSNKIIKLLPEKKIQVEGKNPMSYDDFINGYSEEGKVLLEKLNLI